MSIELRKLNAKITSLGKKTAKWRDDVQFCLIGCAQHAYDNSNVDPATRLVAAVTGADKTAIVKWVELHMPARWVQRDAAFKFNKSFAGEYDAVSLMSEPWWELATKEKNIRSTFDALVEVRALVKRLTNELAKTHTVKHSEILADLTNLANKVEYADKEAQGAE